MLCSVAGTLVLAIFIDGSKQCPPWVETEVTHTELQGPGQVSPHLLPTPTMGRSLFLLSLPPRLELHKC